MKNKKILIVILLVALLTLNFAKNFISNSSIKIGEIDFWNFQNDSEYLVLSKIFKDKYNMENSRYGLSKFINENDEILDINQLQDNDYIQNCESQNYISQLGLQGHIFSFLYNKLHITIGALNLACCLLLAIVLVAICYVIYNKYSKLMGWIFYITFLLSPWVVAFAKKFILGRIYMVFTSIIWTYVINQLFPKKDICTINIYINTYKMFMWI